MKQTGKKAGRRVLATVAIATLCLAVADDAPAAATGAGANDPEARFRGALSYDFGVRNVKWEAATPEYSYVTFDLHWSYSWRAKWTEPSKTSATGSDIEIESWDAAWVFVKFLPDKDSKVAQERNHWLHATLDKNPANHVMPAGAMNSVKLSDDGARGMGVFIYRDAVGHGVNDWKHIKLRWLHPPSSRGASARDSGATGGGKFDPSKAGVRVFPIPMVHVPQGPFKIGTGGASGISPFPDGFTLPSAQADHMPGARDIGSLTDGSWRGGPVVPFLADAEWNGPAAEGSRARRIGAAAGQLWTTLTYVETGVGGSTIGDPGVLGDEYPTGYEAFYCMKYDVTQGQYVDYLNSLPPDVAAGRSCLGTEVGCDYPMPRSAERGGLTIKVSGWPGEGSAGGAAPKRSIAEPDMSLGILDLADQMLEKAEREDEVAAAAPVETGLPPLYSARLPFRSCSGISRSDMYAYAIWTGMRPMSELEFEKARRGARNPVPHENDTGTTNGVRADMSKDWIELGRPTERFARGNSAGGYGSEITVFRVGCFATPASDRVAAGATYWGILELGGNVVSALRREFRGTHGDGTSPAGNPDAALRRYNAPCAGNADWPPRIGGRGGNDRTWINGEYIDGRFVWNRARLVISASAEATADRSAENRKKKAAPKTGAVMTPSPAVAAGGASSGVGEPRRASSIRAANVTWKPGGKDTSTVSFDLAWDNSWHARWQEPAEGSVTGNPPQLENRDAAWVFLKFRPAGADAFSHAMLSPNAADHRVPAGATLDVGLSNDGAAGVGVFIYRSAFGKGANDFRNIKLRWIHPGGAAPAKDTPLRAYAIEMVYVPRGAFQSKVPWEQSLTTIRSAAATDKWGRRAGADTPTYAEYPNGHNAFYCAKYGISQGQYADYLNSLAPARAAADYPGAYGINRFTIRCDTNTGVFKADFPDRPCNFLRWSRILSYEAWAGLRPLTDLEYEKACRGPRAVARREDAWADGVCAPAAGIAGELLPSLPEIDAGASYWGIRGLSLGGCVHEWPGIIFPYKNGKEYRGSHGDGSPTTPPDWPDHPALGQYGDRNMAYGAVWMTPDNLSRTLALGEFLLFDNTGRYGARAVRSAPFRQDESPALQLDALPNLSRYDVGIFRLTGRFRNSEDAPVKVEIAVPLPDACFVEGPASRAFTAAPGTDTPFRILVAVTRMNAAGAMQEDNVLPVQIRAVGGEVLACQTVKLVMDKAEGGPRAIRAFEGGTIEARLRNASDRPVSVSVVLDPVPDCKPAESERRVEIAAQEEAAVTFPVPRQGFPAGGIRAMPFRVTVGEGVAQGGRIPVNLLNHSRWWMGRNIKGRRPGSRGEPEPGKAPAAVDLSSAAEARAPEGMPQGFFTMDARPRRWKVVEVDVARLPLDEARPLRTRGSSVIAGTRLFAPAEREVKLKVSTEAINDDILRIWVNEKVVFDSRPAAGTGGKSFLLRAGMNTMAASWRSGKDGARDAAEAAVIFTDAKTGQPVTDLVIDMERK